MTAPVVWNVFTHNFDYAGVGGGGSGITALNAMQSSLNNNNGITAAVVGSTGTVLLTNRITGQVSTTDDTPSTIVAFGLGPDPKVYTFQITATAKTDAGDGASYIYYASLKTDGSAATVIGVATPTYFEDTVFNPVDENVLVSANANTVSIEVVGIAATNISWDCLVEYRAV